jgi:hypothetical protein
MQAIKHCIDRVQGQIMQHQDFRIGLDKEQNTLLRMRDELLFH